MTNPAAITPQHTSARRCCTLKNDAESESLTPPSTFRPDTAPRRDRADDPGRISLRDLPLFEYTP